MQYRRVLAPALVLALVVLPDVVLAHGGGLSGAQPERLTIPTWLFLLTGGGVVGASFLLASFVTDRAFLERVHRWHRPVAFPVDVAAAAGRLLGLAGLAVVLVAGFLGPHEPLQNAAVLLVWAGWWAGYTMSVYLLGNTWPAVNPVRTLAEWLAGVVGGDRVDYPDRFGAWPAVVGLLFLIWLEVVSPLAEDPRLLAAVVAGYVAVSLAGALLVGPAVWFGRVDPVSGVFRLYGRVAPFHRANGSLRLVYHGSDLATDRLRDASEAGLVVALVWGTTYDGLVQTPLWAGFARTVVGAGVPAALLYPAVLALGYLVFLGVYWAASARVRESAPTYLATGELARLFAPSLLAIAAGYHLAHYLSYFLALSPALAGALMNPLSEFDPLVLSMPGWTGGLSIAFVLLGHLLAIWVAHGVAYEEFPSRLQAVRSQYAVTAVMVVYTMVSLWIVTQPSVAPPYV